MTYFLRASAYDHLRDYKKAAENFHLFLKVANGKYPDQVVAGETSVDHD